MRKRVCVVGMGLVTAAGPSLRTTWERLIRGDVCISPLPDYIAKYVQPRYGHLVDLQSFGSVERCRLSGIALHASEQAVQGGKYVDTICVGSTSAGFLEAETVGLRKMSFEIDNYTELIGVLSDRYNASNAFQTSQACASSSYAIALAVDMIRAGESRFALAGGADELTACVIDAFDSCRIYADRCKPFDVDRKGVVLGEAAAFLLLTTVGRAEFHGLTPMAFIDGVGLTSDAMSSVATGSVGVRKAILQAVSDAEELPINFVCAHGTGTKQNDAAEADAIRQAFIEDMDYSVPWVSSYKGCLGHPQGSSGAVGVVLSIEAMRRQRMFPTVGCDTPGPHIPIPVVQMSMTDKFADLHRSLVLSSGTWGVDSALVITRNREC